MQLHMQHKYNDASDLHMQLLLCKQQKLCLHKWLDAVLTCFAQAFTSFEKRMAIIMH